MAASPNPLVGMIMSALQARTAGGGGMPGQTMPGQGGQPGQIPGQEQGPDAGAQYAQQVSELKGADPGMLLRQLKQMKQICAVLMVQNLERLPNVSGQLSKLVPMFDRVIKEVGQAQNVNSAVRPPIAMGAAQPPQDMGGGLNSGGGF
jgi:hypothetical protein